MELKTIIDVCKAIADGETVQWSYAAGIQLVPPRWYTVPPDTGSLNISFANYRWRTVPKTIKYRSALVNHGAVNPVYNIQTAWNEADEERISKFHNFVKWLGDWQEVEIEE